MFRQTGVTLFVLAAALPAQAQPAPRPQVHQIVRERAEVARDVRRTVLYQQGREEQTDRQTKTVKIGSDGELSLGNIAGDIVVSKGGGGDATIEIVKTARARTADEAKEMLGLVQVTVAERSGRAEVRTVYAHDDDRRDHRRNINVTVGYTVVAPAGTRLTVSSISGSIRVSDIKGDLTLNSISGAVRVANAGRIAAAKSISGNVEIVDTEIDGAIDADSISGNVVLRKVRARRMNLGSVSGTVLIQDAACDRVEAHSISGNVEFAGTLAKNGRYELASHSGGVRVAVDGGTGFEVDATSFSGSIRSDIPLKMQGGDDERGRRRNMHGVYGDGSAVLDLTTFSGTIVISKR
jgi:hypothetical protein